MGNLLDGILQDDNDFGFFDSDIFGVAVTFRPWNGTPRTIKISAPEPVDPTEEELQRNIREVMLIHVSNHATRGILITTFIANKDQIDLAYRPGETPRTYTLRVPVSVDSAQLIFRVY